MFDVSIIIVNYNTKQLLDDCIASIYSMTHNVSFEILVSDNGSKDDSLNMLESKYPQVISIANNANLGFGAANNRALDKTHGKYIFYLNSDTILLNNAVKYFFDYFESHLNTDSIGAIGANLLDKDGRIIHSSGKFPSGKTEAKNCVKDFIRTVKLSLPIVNKIHFLQKKQLAHDSIVKPPYYGKVDYVTGADLFMMNDKYARFDERFVLYYEDTDLCKNLSLNGKICYLIDGPKIVHLKGQSVFAHSVLDFYGSFSKIHTMLSSVIFQKKYTYPKKYSIICKLFTFLMWLNPHLFKKTKNYIPLLLKA
jgi:GT2 family glycosyltransferase